MTQPFMIALFTFVFHFRRGNHIIGCRSNIVLEALHTTLEDYPNKKLKKTYLNPLYTLTRSMHKIKQKKVGF